MPTCTPIYQLPYAIGSDPPCDIGETLCAFATAVEAELDRLDEVVDRTFDTIPMAQVRLTVSTVLASNPGGGTPASVPWDTVDVDTADMVDLATNPYIVTLPRTGRYAAAVQVQGATVGAANQLTVSIAGITADTYIDDASTPVYLNGGFVFRYAVAGTPGLDITNPQVSVTISSPSVTFTVTAVTLTVYWLGDLP